MAGLISGWLIIPTLILLIALPAVFSTPNDKRHIVIATPGWLRVLLELLLYLVAAVAPWFVWSLPLASVSVLVVVVSIVLGIPRLIWLLRGAVV